MTTNQHSDYPAHDRPTDGQVAFLDEPGQTYNAELIAGPSGWRTVPGAVRLAIWLWAVATILSFAAGIVVGAFTLLALVAS